VTGILPRGLKPNWLSAIAVAPLAFVPVSMDDYLQHLDFASIGECFYADGVTAIVVIFYPPIVTVHLLAADRNAFRRSGCSPQSRKQER
jgi:hypothetical protein